MKDIEERRMRYMEYRFSDAPSVSECFPSVDSIVVDYTITYESAFGCVIDKGCSTYNRESKVVFLYNCRNNDCTGLGFDLFPEIHSSISENKETYSGELKCQGKEAPDHSNACPTKMEYSIRVVYRKGSR